LRAAVVLLTFVSVALVVWCRHGDQMEFTLYHEYSTFSVPQWWTSSIFPQKASFFST
jgi:hypothetical protein